MRKIVDDESRPNWSSILDPGALQLVKLVMHSNPKSRLTPTQVIHHPWVTGTAASCVDLDIIVMLFCNVTFSVHLLRPSCCAS